MNIWLAGVPGGGSMGDCKRERELNKYWKLRLWSYYHLIITNAIMSKTKNKVDLFLDSGAFSAWTQKTEINIQEYIQFIKENEGVINVYANLDVIGDAKATWRNQQIMERAGLNPIPCYHYGEDEKWLKLYIDRYEYIALGGMVKVGTEMLMKWLDPLFSKYLIDEKGFPVCKIHGFGLTSLPLMLRYPWYSVDSTSWVVTGRMGSIYVPRYKVGKWIYDEQSWKVAVSNRSPNKKEAGQHIETIPPLQKKIILEYIHSKGYKLGVSEFKKVKCSYELKENEKWAEKKEKNQTERLLEIIKEPGISNKYQLRDEMNIIYFLDLEKSLPEWPWAFKKNESKKLF